MKAQLNQEFTTLVLRRSDLFQQFKEVEIPELEANMFRCRRVIELAHFVIYVDDDGYKVMKSRANRLNWKRVDLDSKMANEYFGLQQYS